MVLVEHLLGMLQVKVVLGHFPPRKVKHELDIVVLRAVVRGVGVAPLQLGHLFLENLLH